MMKVKMKISGGLRTRDGPSLRRPALRHRHHPKAGPKHPPVPRRRTPRSRQNHNLLTRTGWAVTKKFLSPSRCAQNVTTAFLLPSSPGSPRGAGFFNSVNGNIYHKFCFSETEFNGRNLPHTSWSTSSSGGRSVAETSRSCHRRDRRTANTFHPGATAPARTAATVKKPHRRHGSAKTGVRDRKCSCILPIRLEL